MESQSRTTTRRNLAVRVVGSIGAVGAAAAVAGLGTFGDFTQSSAPVETQVDSGIVSIDLAEVGASGTVPFDGGLFLPGDSRSHLIDVVNSGNTDFGSLRLDAWATASSILDSDPVDGLQLAVEACPVPWSVADSVYSCAAGATSFYSGPIVASVPTPAGAALDAGEVGHLRLTASLPSTANADTFEGAESSLSFVFTATQRAGGAR
jgi:hypothetical protein